MDLSGDCPYASVTGRVCEQYSRQRDLALTHPNARSATTPNAFETVGKAMFADLVRALRSTLEELKWQMDKIQDSIRKVMVRGWNGLWGVVCKIRLCLLIACAQASRCVAVWLVSQGPCADTAESEVSDNPYCV